MLSINELWQSRSLQFSCAQNQYAKTPRRLRLSYQLQQRTIVCAQSVALRRTLANVAVVSAVVLGSRSAEKLVTLSSIIHGFTASRPAKVSYGDADVRVVWVLRY